METIIFDLDNTLYDVRQYFLSAFNEISEYLSKKYSISKEDNYDQLVAIWETKTSMYPHLFDNLLKPLKLENELENVIKIFNEHNAKILPYEDTIFILSEIKKRNIKLGLITDGTVNRQKRKLKTLGISYLFDSIIFTKNLNASKPSTIPFKEAINCLKTKPHNTYYVGDNPLVDFKGAKETGMKTVRLLKGEFKKVPTNKYVDYEIKELKQLLSLMNGF